jgi:hypothetical protein
MRVCVNPAEQVRERRSLQLDKAGLTYR